MGSLRSPGDPSCTFAPLLDPGRTGAPCLSGHTDAAPAYSDNEGFGRLDFGADSRSFGTCSPTLRVSYCHSRARLASGWLASLYREGVDPLDHDERFPVTWPFPSPVLLTLQSSCSDRARNVRPPVRAGRSQDDTRMISSNDCSWGQEPTFTRLPRTAVDPNPIVQLHPRNAAPMNRQVNRKSGNGRWRHCTVNSIDGRTERRVRKWHSG
jgi:hypothetical protein